MDFVVKLLVHEEGAEMCFSLSSVPLWFLSVLMSDSSLSISKATRSNVVIPNWFLKTGLELFRSSSSVDLMVDVLSKATRSNVGI